MEQADINTYRKLLKDKGIYLSYCEVEKLVVNIDNIGNLLFNKYLKHGKEEESNNLL